MGASDVKAEGAAAKDEPGDGVPVPLTPAAKSRSSRRPANANGNGNGARASKPTGTGSGNGARTAKGNGHGTRAPKRNGNGAHTVNGNGNRAHGANGNGATAKRNGNGNGASTATRAALDRDELTALVETAQRTIEPTPPPAPPPAREIPEPLELDRGLLLDRPPPPRPLPADRRAKLLASLARRAEELALAEERDRAPAEPVPRPRTKVVRRVVVVLALLVPPAAIGVMLKTDATSAKLSRADATFVAGQLVDADQRLRAQLLRVPANGTALAIVRAREAELTTRSLTVEVQAYGGPEAARLREALRLEREWIAAVGSTLMNPRSALRDELVARGAVAREALEALPGPSGKRLGGVRSLVSYARSRVAATGAGTP
jgi:hypothetical protein